jgi:hypothetical protein
MPALACADLRSTSPVARPDLESGGCVTDLIDAAGRRRSIPEKTDENRWQPHCSGGIGGFRAAVTRRLLARGGFMSPLTLVGIVLMAVIGIMYVLRRKSRLNRGN